MHPCKTFVLMSSLALLSIAGCGEAPPGGVVEQAREKVDDALDRRPNEKLKDAAEDLQKAAQDAGQAANEMARAAAESAGKVLKDAGRAVEQAASR